MRLRNVKNAMEILKNSKYFIENPEKYKDNWQKEFSNENQISLEIGIGKGDFIIGMALRYPNINFIGIEKYESVLVRAVEKLDKLKLDNVKVICTDASNIESIFSKEIDTIYLNFSDPWPKKRHAKRRLTDKEFLKIYDKIFKDSSNIIMKTDNDLLFESTLINLNNYGYKFDELYLDLWSIEKENIKTEYEVKFSNLGFKIKYIKAHKK